MIDESRSHCWRDAKRLVDAAEVVVHKVQFVVECVGHPSYAADIFLLVRYNPSIVQDGVTDTTSEATSTTTEQHPPRRVSIRGWLLIPPLGLIGGILFLLWLMSFLWQQPTDQTPGLARCGVQVIILLAALVVFFQKRRFAPKVMIALYVVGIIYGVYQHEKQKVYLSDHSGLVAARRASAQEQDAAARIQNPLIKAVTPTLLPQ